MIEALIGGERRGGVLADLAIGRMRTAGKMADLSMALAGRFTEHHALMCRLHLDRIAVFDDAVDGLDEQIAGKAARWQRETGLLKTLPGFGDVVARLAGRDRPRPAPALRHRTRSSPPGSRCARGTTSARRKRKHGRTGDAGTYIKPMLIQAAWAAIRVRGRLQARYSRLVRRFGGAKNPGAKKKAITAIAHTLLKIAYQVLKTGTPYHDPGADFYTRRESPEQQAGLPGAAAPEAPPRLRHHHHHQPAGGRLTTRRLTEACPSSPGAAADPAPRPFRRTSQRHCPALATAQARVRCRAPTGDPVIVSGTSWWLHRKSQISGEGCASGVKFRAGGRGGR